MTPNRLKIYVSALIVLFLCGCGAVGEPAPGPETHGVPLMLVLEQRSSAIVTRAGNNHSSPGVTIEYKTDVVPVTRSLADDPDYKLEDVIIMQFDGSGDLLHSEYIAGLSGVPAETVGSGLVYKPALTLMECASSTVVAVANTASPGLFAGVTTLDDYLSAECALPARFSDTSGDLLPMSGIYTGEVGTETAVRIEMERLLAKLRVRVNVGSLSDGRTLDLNTLEVKSVPVNTLYHNTYKGFNADAIYTNPGYPVLPGDRFESIDAGLFTDYPAPEFTRGEEIIFYLPENIRGRGYNYSSVNGPLHQRYKNSESDPTITYWSYWSGLGFDETDPEIGVATRLWFSGKYTTVEDGDMDILMTLYPGDDNQNDYNIRRNTFYDIEVNVNDVVPFRDIHGNENYASGDKRIYVWGSSDEDYNSYAGAPVFNPLWTGEMILFCNTGMFYVDPGDTLEEAWLHVMWPNGQTDSQNVMPSVSQTNDGETYLFEDVSFFSPMYLRADDVLTGWIQLKLANQGIVTGEKVYLIVNRRT